MVVNGARDDARYTLGFGKPGTYGILLDFNKIPHRFGNDAHMLYTETGKGVLSIPDATQLALQTAITNAPRANITFAFLNNLLAPYLANDIGLQRDRALARFNLGSLGPWAFGIEYTQESRKGNRAYGGSFGFSNATEIPEPIDYDTSGAEIAGEWNGQNGGLRLGYRYSKFENNVSTLTWDNPFRITDATDPNAYTAPGAGSIGGAVRGFADLASDNKADMLFLDGRTRLGSWVLSGNVFHETMKQNDPLLPYTLNTAIVGIHENGTTFDRPIPPTCRCGGPISRSTSPKAPRSSARASARRGTSPSATATTITTTSPTASNSPATCATTPCGKRSAASRCPTSTLCRTPAPSSAGTSCRAPISRSATTGRVGTASTARSRPPMKTSSSFRSTPVRPTAGPSAAATNTATVRSAPTTPTPPKTASWRKAASAPTCRACASTTRRPAPTTPTNSSASGWPPTPGI